MLDFLLSFSKIAGLWAWIIENSVSSLCYSQQEVVMNRRWDQREESGKEEKNTDTSW
jgi:type III secretory pathway lipoprotein EscJ